VRGRLRGHVASPHSWFYGHRIFNLTFGSSTTLGHLPSPRCLPLFPLGAADTRVRTGSIPHRDSASTLPGTDRGPSSRSQSRCRKGKCLRSQETPIALRLRSHQADLLARQDRPGVAWVEAVTRAGDCLRSPVRPSPSCLAKPSMVGRCLPLLAPRSAKRSGARASTQALPSPAWEHESRRAPRMQA
jgi:hypothetical protein